MLKYRPDIDGLRAIAVVSVVLYHLQESLLPGGFVGVDIFFVISGYLITKLIVNELAETETFSFKRFYIRRVRRLFPALLATLLLSLGLAYWLFSPAHLVEFAQSLIASILSVSNIFFWSLTDYFDTESTLKPLLHTWSLSVEEQFYFIWPAILVFLTTRKRTYLIPSFILVMGVVSLLLNIVVFNQQTSIESWLASVAGKSTISVQSTAFYWLPFRVFEFAIGAILVWAGTIKHKSLAELSFVVGLLMVLSSVFVLDSKMDFPSTAALLPCLGAALMMFSGPQHRLAWLIANRGMVGIGLISYSLYLIHWPLIVFYKYYLGRELVSNEMLVLALGSVVIAALMYRYVEQPFRAVRQVSKTEKSPSHRPFLISAAVAAIATIAVGANAISSQGWLWRYPADRIAQLSYKKGDYTEFFWSNIKRLEKEFDNDHRPKVLIVGDSMAADLVNVLVAGNAEQQLDLATISINHNCKTLFGFSDAGYRSLFGGAAEKCQTEHARVLAKTSLLDSADTIVLASHLWERNQAERIPETVDFLRTRSSAQIMVLGLKVQINNGIQFLSQHAFNPQAHTLRSPLHPQAGQINALLRRSADNYSYFDLLDGFCDKDGCQRITEDGYAIIFDGSHLSENGARFLAAELDTKAWYQQMISTHSD